MKRRALHVTALLAMGLLVASSQAAAQEAPAVASGGQVTIGALGVGNINSAKFHEYREVPKGLSVPFMNLFSTSDALDVNLLGYNVRQDDQRYMGWISSSAFGLSFDYNQVVHNMGYNGTSIFAESAPGVWTLPTTLRQSLEASVLAQPTAGRTALFYDGLLAPVFASANSVDISSLRKRGSVELTLGKSLPVNLVVSYMRELKSGYRTLSGGNVRAQVNPSYEVPEPLNELTQDFGLRATYNFKAGNVHAAFNRNLYNNKAETLIIDDPFQAFDSVNTSTVGGPSRARFINAPDNEASTATGGFLLKFARQTRLGGDVSIGRWTQDAAFYPYTINTVILTPGGARADGVSALPQKSFDGKINTTMLNVTFSTRPVTGLAIRASFRSYDLANKTNRFVITGDTAVSDRVWTVVTPSADNPYGHATANVYDSKKSRFTGSASYDLGPLTLEAQVRAARLTRTSREAEKGDDNGLAFTALFHASEWLGVRATYDQAKRTAEGHTLYGFQADEAERETKRTGIDIELTPSDMIGVSVAYFRRDVQYTNRPDRIPVTSGAPSVGAVAFPSTPSGLLEAVYDSYTGEIDFNPNERVELSAYYTYEKDQTTNQWSTTTGLNLNNLLNYAGSDETNTFGANAVIQLVPEKWTCTFSAMRQKVDGLMDITAREAGSFYTPGRTGLIGPGQGGAADINDWDDTELTTVSAQLDYVVAKAWTMSAGYAYEKYDFSDAYTSSSFLMPQAVYIFMKPDNGAYKANVVYAQLNYKF